MAALVSILIPAYNCERWIGETIASALAQTCPRKEVIIVDDGSTDGTLAVARRYESGTVRVVGSEHRGAGSARNRALQECQGDYIQWLDSDDLLAPDKIEQQLVCAVAENCADVLYGGAWARFMYRRTRVVYQPGPLWQDLDALEWLLLRVGGRSWLPPIVWLISRELSQKAGLWDERLSLDDDGEYSCRLVSRCRLVRFVPESHAFYRVANQSSLSSCWSPKAWESLFLSTTLKVLCLLSVEDSERTRAASIRRLNWVANSLEQDAPCLSDQLRQRVAELGGVPERQRESWRYGMLQKVLGPRRASRFRLSAWRLQRHAVSEVDRLLAWLSERETR